MTAPIPSPIWQPACARIIPISPSANLRERGLVPSITVQSWAPKSAADHFDFSLTLSEILSDTEDYIARILRVDIPTASGSPTDLTVLWSSIVNGMACVMLGGGEPGTTQTIVVYALTQQGRRLATRIELAITTETDAVEPTPAPTLPSSVPVPPNAIQLLDEAILLDAAGQPYLIA